MMCSNLYNPFGETALFSAPGALAPSGYQRARWVTLTESQANVNIPRIC